MLKRKLVLTITALCVAFLPLTACSQENRDTVDEITSLKYTGNPDQDVKSLCSLSRTLTEFSNNNNKMVQDSVNKVATDYAAQSSDQRVDLAAGSLKKMTSADQAIRAQGEKDLKKLCRSL